MDMGRHVLDRAREAEEAGRTIALNADSDDDAALGTPAPQEHPGKDLDSLRESEPLPDPVQWAACIMTYCTPGRLPGFTWLESNDNTAPQ